MSINVAGFWVADHVGPAEADRNDVGVEDVEPVFPNEFASVGIEAQATFLFGNAFTVATDHVNAVILNDRGCAPTVGSAPDEVVVWFGSIWRPTLWQVGFEAHSVLPGPAPVGPVGRIHGRTKQHEAGDQNQRADAMHGNSSEKATGVYPRLGRFYQSTAGRRDGTG